MYILIDERDAVIGVFTDPSNVRVQEGQAIKSMQTHDLGLTDTDGIPQIDAIAYGAHCTSQTEKFLNHCRWDNIAASVEINRERMAAMGRGMYMKNI